MPEVLSLVYRKNRKKKKHLQPIAMHLTETKHFLTLTLGM